MANWPSASARSAAYADRVDQALLRQTIIDVAPGTALRDGLERILRGRTGALIVLGHDKTLEAISSGGFALDVPFTATALRELAKMDGALVVDRSLTRIVRAGVQLLPDAAIPTVETGTRHRTADRVSQQSGFPVVSVSKSMHIISVYVSGERYLVENPTTILSRANQALGTLERYKLRLDEVSATLSALEVEDLVTLRDVAHVAQRQEMVRRIAAELEGYIRELGTDGRLLALQYEELIAGVQEVRVLMARDYLPGKKRSPGIKANSSSVTESVQALDSLDAKELLELNLLAAALGYPGEHVEDLDRPLSPRGYRLLARVPRLPEVVMDRLVEHFGGLQRLLAAEIEDLRDVEGVGEGRALSVRESLSRLADTSTADHFG